MPWLQIVTGLISGASSVIKGEERKDVERKLENMQTPTYRRNQSIIDFYDEALRKYKVTPTETAAYKIDKQNAMQGTTQGLRALQDRRSGLAGIPALISGQNNALLKASVRAEQDKSRQAGIVSNAASAASAERMRDFQYNNIAPFEKEYNLLARKAAGLAAAQNKATENAYKNLSSGIGSMGSGGGSGTFGGWGG